MRNRSFSQQLPINLLSNVGVFLIGIVINLFMTPFYIRHIGLDGLGLIRLALILPVYTGLVSLVISKSVGRFLTIDLQKEDILEANKTLNTAFFSISAILLFLIPIIFILSFNIEFFFNIPSGLKEESTNLFLGVLLASVIGLFTGLFMIPAYANNRLDIANLSGIITKLLQPGLIVFLLVYVSMDLSLVGYAYLATSFVGLMISMYIWKEFAPDLTINYKFFHMEKLKEMTATGSWIMINQLGAMFFLYIDLIVINVFFGAAQTGEYSTVLQWSTLLRSIASVFVGVIGPMIMISYAKNHMEKIIQITTVSVKMLGLLMAIPIGIISGFAAPLLTVWLGDSFAHLAPLMWLIILPLTINLSILPLFNVQVALNQVKIPGLFSLFIGIGNLLLTLLFVKIFDIGIYSVALASAIMLIVKNFIFTPLYTAYILGLKKTFFFKYTISGFFLSIAIFILALLLQNWVPVNSWFMLITISAIICVLSLLFIWFLLLNNEEKEWILQIIKRKKG